MSGGPVPKGRAAARLGFCAHLCLCRMPPSCTCSTRRETWRAHVARTRECEEEAAAGRRGRAHICRERTGPCRRRAVEWHGWPRPRYYSHWVVIDPLVDVALEIRHLLEASRCFLIAVPLGANRLHNHPARGEPLGRRRVSTSVAHALRGRTLGPRGCWPSETLVSDTVCTRARIDGGEGKGGGGSLRGLDARSRRGSRRLRRRL